ncbi:phage tail assembly protein [Neorhizobium sp. T786]|uniref:phage tail assembly protein n=1 Tax=Pseudorhizobium xiangyangii TaxID=2883104 RepID=UPI001CFF9FCB|nr:phage tail assembly protein [Neorhizobium xiangyangii]MCB5201728.1 phage tail assembly protein [Neorhizobium xiangyangii]
MTAAIQKLVQHTLILPVAFEGSEKSTITLRRLKGKDIKKLREYSDDVDKTFFLIGELSGWPPEGVDELDGADFEAISKIIEGFMGRKAKR